MSQTQDRLSLSNVRLSCTTVFTDADEPLDQAHAILTLLGNAFQCDDEAEQQAGAIGKIRQSCFKELTGDLFRDALGGVSSLLAVHRHLIDVDNAACIAEASR